MKLSAELRLEVYKYHLIQDSPIELWPHVKENTMYNANRKRSNALGWYIGLKYTLCFLRVSSVVNEEAGQVFYGANEFRFSGINGWMVFSAFLHTIGPRHYQFLQHMSIHVPFPGVDYLAQPRASNLTFVEKVCYLRPEQHFHFRTRLRRIFQIPENWSYDWCIADSILKLATTDLRYLRLVLPPTYYIDHSTRLGWYWDQLRRLKDTLDTTLASQDRDCLHVGFVFLKIKDREQEASAFVRSQFPWLNRYTGQVKRMMEKIRERDWIESVHYGVHGCKGRYEILDREACEKITGPEAMRKEEIYEEDWTVEGEAER